MACDSLCSKTPPLGACVGLQCVIVVYHDHTHLLFGRAIFLYLVQKLLTYHLPFRDTFYTFCKQSRPRSGSSYELPDQGLLFLLMEI